MPEEWHLRRAIVFLETYKQSNKKQTGQDGLLEIARAHCPPARGSGNRLSTMNKTKLAEYIATDPRGKAWLQQTHDITVVALGLDDVATLVNSSSEASVRVNVTFKKRR